MPKQKIGSKRKVWNGTADKTSGGLTVSNLKKNKWGKIVSKRKSANAAANFRKNGLKPATAEELKKIRLKRSK